MDILKRILFGIIGLIVLILAAGLLIEEEYGVEREVTISLMKDDVFEYVKFLKNQDEFSVWAKRDPNMEKGFTGTDGTVGCVSSWSSDNPDVGKGEQEIVGITPGERIDYELRFIEPFESRSDAWMTTTAMDSNTTKVVWGFSGKMEYPMNLMLLTMDMEGLIAKDLQTGLDELKVILESQSGRES